MVHLRQRTVAKSGRPEKYNLGSTGAAVPGVVSSSREDSQRVKRRPSGSLASAEVRCFRVFVPEAWTRAGFTLRYAAALANTTPPSTEARSLCAGVS